MIKIGVFEGGSAVIMKQVNRGKKGYYGNENEQDEVAIDR